MNFESEAEKLTSETFTEKRFSRQEKRKAIKTQIDDELLQKPRDFSNSQYWKYN